MNRLQSELHRLYLPRVAVDALHEPSSSFLIDPFDRTRTMVLEVTRPPSWELLGRVWLGVQTELELPAPGIAVSGSDGLQLWFSLVDAIAVAQAHAFLEALRSRFLPEVERERMRLMPASEASVLDQALHAALAPAPQASTGHWSAFVSSDLAAVFVDTPWLDIPPGDEGQAALLRGLESVSAAAFEAACRRLERDAAATASAPDAASDLGRRSERPAPSTRAGSAAEAGDEPRRFLLRVMNDESVPMALRIEAAKSLM
jgi:hypothetical protein